MRSSGPRLLYRAESLRAFAGTHFLKIGAIWEVLKIMFPSSYGHTNERAHHSENPLSLNYAESTPWKP